MVAEEGGPADLLQLLRLMLRSWIVVIPILAATVAVTWVVVERVPVYQEAEGKVIIQPPRLDAVGAPTGTPAAPVANPFAVFDPSLSVVSVVVAEVLDDPAVRDRLTSVGASQDYSIETDGVWESPILTIHAASRTADVSVQTIQIVISAIQQELVDQQMAAGADPRSYVTARALIPLGHTTSLYAGRVRSALVCGAIGVGGAIAASLALGRRRRARLGPRLDPYVGVGDGRVPSGASRAPVSSWG